LWAIPTVVAHGFVDMDQVDQLGDSRLALAFSKLWAQLALGGGAISDDMNGVFPCG